MIPVRVYVVFKADCAEAACVSVCGRGGSGAVADMESVVEDWVECFPKFSSDEFAVHDFEKLGPDFVWCYAVVEEEGVPVG